MVNFYRCTSFEVEATSLIHLARVSNSVLFFHDHRPNVPAIRQVCVCMRGWVGNLLMFIQGLSPQRINGSDSVRHIVFVQ